MAIWTDKNDKKFVGCVIAEHEHMWMDGMLEVSVSVWDDEKQCIDYHQVGYFGIDGCNLCNKSWNVDLTPENARKVIRWYKRIATNAYATHMIVRNRDVEKGDSAVVVRGRKVPKGTKLNVFWVGDRPTYESRIYSWVNDTERIAGCFDESGNKVWVRADYLKKLNRVKESPRERNNFIKKYVRCNLNSVIFAQARA